MPPVRGRSGGREGCPRWAKTALSSLSDRSPQTSALRFTTSDCRFRLWTSAFSLQRTCQLVPQLHKRTSAPFFVHRILALLLRARPPSTPRPPSYLDISRDIYIYIYIYLLGRTRRRPGDTGGRGRARGRCAKLSPCSQGPHANLLIR